MHWKFRSMADSIKINMNRRTFAAGATAAATLLLTEGEGLAKPARAQPAAVAGAEDVLGHVNPELRAQAEQLLKMTPPEGITIDIKQLGAGRKMMPLKPPLAEPAIVERSIPGPAGAPAVPVFIVNARPGASKPVILHLHGGGFVLGDARGDLKALQAQALALDCVIVAPNYRLAPETTFPGPLEDAYAALVWTSRHCNDLGGDPKRIAIQGESAGGGLAAMLALTARDRGEVRVVHQSLVYPMLDDRTGQTPLPFPVGRLGWTGSLNQAGWAAFLGRKGAGAVPPAGAVPARETNLRGLPDTFIVVGAIDLFVLEDMTYAQRLVSAAVPTTLLVVPGAFHGFDVMAPESNIARQSKQAQFQALSNAFGNKPAIELSVNVNHFAGCGTFRPG